MAQNIHFNEVKLWGENGVYKLNLLGEFKKRFPNYDEELIWKFVKKNLSFREKTSIPNSWIFFITDKNKVHSFTRHYGSLSRMSVSDILRKIVMSGAEKVVLVMEHDLKEYRETNYYPTVMTHYFRKKLESFNDVTIIDTLVVNDITYFSLKKNNLI